MFIRNIPIYVSKMMFTIVAISYYLFPPSGYIHNNSYYLIDVTNQSTRWGVWSPSELNLNQSWSDEHGLNSLQILSYLLSAYRITSNNVYLKAFKVR